MTVDLTITMICFGNRRQALAGIFIWLTLWGRFTGKSLITYKLVSWVHALLLWWLITSLLLCYCWDFQELTSVSLGFISLSFAIFIQDYLLLTDFQGNFPEEVSVNCHSGSSHKCLLVAATIIHIHDNYLCKPMDVSVRLGHKTQRTLMNHSI